MAMGRKSLYAMVDGVPELVKKPVPVAGSIYCGIPKETMEIWELKGEIKWFVLRREGETVVITPCYDDLEVGKL